MKIYEIMDTENKTVVGVLLYFEKDRSFVIELKEDLDEWTAPLLFAGLVKKNIYTVPRDISRLWVKARIIPPSRQNIGTILDNHHLKQYDEMKLLALSRGKCAQDSLCILEIDEIPDFAAQRMKRNLADCVICRDTSILCLFRDGTIRKVDLTELAGADKADKLQRRRALFESGKITAGGYAITFDEQIDIPAAALYETGIRIPLEQEDLISLIRNNLMDTSEACDMLECSRQNLSYLVRKKQLSPIREKVKGNLYLKGALLENTW